MLMLIPSTPRARKLRALALIVTLVGLLAPLFATVARAGEVGGDDFRISFQGPEDDINFTTFTPALAYNSSADEYLVAWSGTRGPGAEAIYIQRVAADGTLLTTAGAAPGTPVRVSTYRGDQIYDGLVPELAYNPDRNEYLLVYRQDDSQLGLVDNQYEIYGQLLAADGSPLAPVDTTQPVPRDQFNDVTPNGAEISAFRISFMNSDAASPGDAYDPAVAYSPATREFLVVWWGDKETDNRYDIRGRFVGERGALAGAVDLRLSNQGPNPTNTAFAAYDPSVAYSPSSAEFLVVWSANNLSSAPAGLNRLEGKYEIVGQRVSAASRAPIASAPGGFANVQISRTGPDGNLFYDARTPAVSTAPDGRFFVAWQGTQAVSAFTTSSGATDYNQHYEAYGRLVAANGAPLGAADIRLSSMGAADDDARFGLVNGPRYINDTYADYVINDARGGTGSIYSIGGSVDVAYDTESDEFVVVWASDDDSSGMQNGTTEIFTQRVRASDGAEVGRDDLRISSMGPSGNNNYDAHNPAIAYSAAADELLAVWAGTERFMLYEVHGQRLAFAPPTVLNIDTSQGTTDGTLSEGELTRKLIGQLLVQFSEAPVPTINNAAYRVVEAGANRAFDTLTCGPAQGDDLTIAHGASFDSASNTVSLGLNNGTSLPTGRYRLIVCGSGANPIADDDGDLLDGDSDGSAGGDFTRSFSVDRTAPAFTQPPAIDVITNDPAGATVSFDLTAYVSDTIDANPTISCTPASGSFFDTGTTTVRCTATDAAGNTSAERTFQLRVEYRSTPTITTPGDLVREATGPSGAVVIYSATASDASGAVAVSCAPSSGSTFAIGITSVDCSATNAQGSSNESFTVTVRDTTAPVVSVPANITAEATGPTGATVNFTASASDLVDGSRPVSCAPSAGSVFAIGTTSVTCTASDSRSNSGGASFTVTVRDTTGPVVSVPANITAEATGPTGATVNFTASASDLVDGSRPVSCTPSSGSVFGIGTTPVTCSATDSRSNSASAGFTVTVRDSTGPVVSVPANVSLEATGPNGTSHSFTASASDLVDGSRPVSCTPSSGSVFAIGATSVTCTATDSRSNSASASFTVTVRDTTAPALSLPADMTLEATGPNGVIHSFTASASDLVDGDRSVSCAPSSGSAFALGETTVTCTASDSRGNPSQGSFTVTVRDTTDPQLSTPGDVTIEATSAGGAAYSYTVTASDLADSSVTADCSPAAGSLFAIGTTKVSCSATDASGNSGSASFTVTVRDSVGPALSGLNNIITGTDNDAGLAVSYSVTATDLVDGATTVECAPTSGSLFPIGTTTVACSTSDSRGNQSQGSFTVTVRDERIPTLTMPAELVVEANQAGGASVSYIVSASDNQGALTPSCAPAAGSSFVLGETTVTCQVTGRNQLTVSGSFVVRVVDTTRPALRLPADIVAEATSATGARVSFTPTARDIADSSVPVSCTPVAGGSFALGQTTVRCSATDASGNLVSGSFRVSVRDTRAPQLAARADIVVQTNDASGALVNYAAPTASDAVDASPTVRCTPPTGSRFAIGTTTVSCTASDASGNSATASFRVTVRAAAPAAQYRLFLPQLYNNATIPLNNAPCNPNGVSCTPP